LVSALKPRSNNVEATFDFVEATFDFVERIVRLVAYLTTLNKCDMSNAGDSLSRQFSLLQKPLAAVMGIEKFNSWDSATYTMSDFDNTWNI